MGLVHSEYWKYVFLHLEYLIIALAVLVTFFPLQAVILGMLEYKFSPNVKVSSLNTVNNIFGVS